MISWNQKVLFENKIHSFWNWSLQIIDHFKNRSFRWLVSWGNCHFETYHFQNTCRSFRKLSFVTIFEMTDFRSDRFRSVNFRKWPISEVTIFRSVQLSEVIEFATSFWRDPFSVFKDTFVNVKVRKYIWRSSCADFHPNDAYAWRVRKISVLPRGHLFAVRRLNQTSS